MVVCNGRGDRGDHCCYIYGKVCPLLVFVDDLPRCSVWGRWDSPEYQATDAAAWFEEMWPGKGYTCADWPQNIPDKVGRRCCWET